MVKAIPWTLLLAGCPWVTAAEHEQLQAELLGADADTDTDSDTDADADADTDTDSDADTDTGTSDCIDDLLEPNDTLANATAVPGLPADYDGVLCPGDISSSLGVVADVYAVDLAAGEVLIATASDGFVDSCGDQALIVEVLDDSLTQILAFERTDGLSCTTVEAGFGAGRYHVVVSSLDGTTERQDYELVLDTAPCGSSDKDGWLSSDCGGPDCDDGDSSVFPGASDLPGDRIDQDCDGGDELVATCGIDPTLGSPAIGTLACGDTRTQAVWDAWEVFVPSGTPITVHLDNGDGNADLAAFVIDRDGASHFGFADGSGALDNDWSCTNPPWTGGGGCPSDCIATQSAGVSGFMQVWVTQKDGAGCVPDAEYALSVVVDGTPVTPSPIPGLNDDVIPWPP